MARGKHIPIRMCVGCRLRRPKDELLRYVKSGGSFVPSKYGGRGFYICNDTYCFKKAKKKGFVFPEVKGGEKVN